MAAIDSWVYDVCKGQRADKEIALQLQGEIPPITSWIVRGGCAVQCKHCIFPFEGPKAFLEAPNTEAMLSVLGQLSGKGVLVHEGRQLLPSQVPILAAIKRAGHSVSLINNGQYATPAMLSLFEREGLKVDALDVSVDGTKPIHNVQRSSDKAWDWAMDGIRNARRILSPRGKLTSLYTLTPLNCASVREVGETIVPLVDEWHLTTMSLRSGIKHMRADKRGLETALKQLRMVAQGNKKVFLRTYSLADFVWLLEILGDEGRKALKKARLQYNAIALDIGFPFYFYPKSLAVNETLVIDADGWWRVPYCIHYTLDELQSGRNKRGEDISNFSIAPVSPKLDVKTQHVAAAKTWWKTIGQRCLNEERVAVQKFLTGTRASTCS